MTETEETAEIEERAEKLVIIATHGGEDPERASLPFVMGNAALAMDTRVTVILQAAGVTLAKKGIYEHIFAAGLPSLKELVDSFIELGGEILVCIPCIEERNITPEELVGDVKLGKAGKFVLELLEADATACY